MATLCRNRRGTKCADWCKWEKTSLEKSESSFAMQQYLQELVDEHPEDVDRLLKLPEQQDADVWQYEHLRLFCSQLNDFVMLLQQSCDQTSCPEMKADEWSYLCAAHQTPQNCSAIDYIVHTLDGASAVLNSNKFFPSRITVPAGSIKHFQYIARRLYRIFAHAWFHHRTVFIDAENETHLYKRFLLFSTQYDLIPEKLLIIPHDPLQEYPVV